MAFETGGVTYGRGDAWDWTSHNQWNQKFTSDDSWWKDVQDNRRSGNAPGFTNIQGDPYWDHWSDYKLDPSRDWKTTWGALRPLDTDQGRRDSRSWGYNFGTDDRSKMFDTWHDPAYAGWEKGVHMTTGRSTRYIKDKWGPDAGRSPLVEVLDYNAYQRDPIYGAAWSGLGREGKISSVQDILDAEGYMAGAGERDAERQRQAQAQLDATNEQIALLQQQLEDARKPRQIDVGQGQTVGEGGVADYVLELEQQRARELDALTQSLSSQYGTQLADAESAWGSKYDQAESAWGSRYDQQQADWGSKYDQQQADWMSRYNQQQSDWMSKSATRDREFQSRISDLTADWDTQRSAYDTSLSNLNQSITDYQNREQRRLEQAAIESQRARTAAAYARDGRTVNQGVGGVKTQRGLTDPRRNRYGSSFKRTDMPIVNKQLNI